MSPACHRVRGEAGAQLSGATIVLKNPAMRELYALAERAAKGKISVLVLGETGAGKEILARTVHRASPRAAGPLICLNCAALSDTLLESELFGHEKGAFTGALQAKQGLLEAASAGTLFLDEVGEMSLAIQAKMLRAIETRQVLRVGATKLRTVDVRFVAATSRDLDEEIAAKRFRKDLYFRLNGISLAIPPLRERTDEIPSLARVFLEGAAAQLGQAPPMLAPNALARLLAHPWPGNIRELRQAMERALLLGGGATIRPEHLPLEKTTRATRPPILQPPKVAGATRPGSPAGAPARPPLNMMPIEREAILAALARCAGNQTRAAALLGISRRTLCSKLKEHHIPRPRMKSTPARSSCASTPLSSS
jgi:two-component system response regulator AtoC